ncbi:MAG: hypothetical protein HY040_13605 [Planctomycetes bacterium]|nr:hypothetical protein [Planctomycetota bacterium]
MLPSVLGKLFTSPSRKHKSKRTWPTYVPNFDCLENRLCPTSSAIRPGFDSFSLPATDDGSTSAVAIGFSVNYFGTSFDHLFVNNNGNVTFDAPLADFSAPDLTTTSTAIIAPFFADVSTTQGNVVTYGAGTVDGHAAFGVTWPGVGYYQDHFDLLNTFQLVLIDRSDIAAGDFDMEFNYGSIQWETGDASGGVNGRGGDSARVGWSNGTGVPGTFFEMPGSGVTGSFLDETPDSGLVNNSLNSDVMGRYVFPVPAPALVGVIGGTFTYDGSPHAAAGFVTNDNGDDLGSPTFTYNGSSTAPVNAGTYVVIASFAGDANNRPASSMDLLVIGKADPTITVDGGTFTYDGNSHAATPSATGVLGEDLGPFVVTYDGVQIIPVNAGTYSVVASFAGNSNYNPATASTDLTILKADPTVTVIGGVFQFDGNTHPADVSVVGVLGEPLGPVDVTYNGLTDLPFLQGNYDVQANYAGNENYNPASGSATIVINDAGLPEPTLVVTGGTFVYDGNPHAATATATGINGEDLGPVDITYNGLSTAPTLAGTYNVVAHFLGDSNYSEAFQSTSLIIQQADPTLTITDLAFTYDGQTHEATVSAAGVSGEPLGPVTVTYNGSATLPVNAGSYTVFASYGGDNNYNPATQTATLVISKADPTFNVTGGTFVYDNLVHGASASATGVNGEDLFPVDVSYTGAGSFPLFPGTYLAHASYSGDDNYNPAAGTATVVILKADPTLTVTTDTFTFDGFPHAATATATGVVGEPLGPITVTYDGSTDEPVNAGSYSVIASFAGDDNYNPATAFATLTILKADPTLTVDGGTFNYDGQTHEATASATGVNGEDLGPVDITYNGSPDAPLNAGSYSVVASFAGDDNYNAATQTATLTILKADPTLTVDAGTFVYDGQTHEATASATGVNGEDLGLVSITYNGSPDAPFNAGSYAVVASFAGDQNYNPATQTATLTILKADPTLTVDHPQSQPDIGRNRRYFCL